MDLYEKAIFDAFVWTQAIENVVHDLVLDCADNRRLQLNDKDWARPGQLKLSLGQLIGKLKPCVTEDFCNKLKVLNRMRIEVVHHSGYVEGILRAVQPSTMVENEMRRLQEVKNYAENIYADLCKISSEFFPIGEPPVTGLLE